MSLRAARIAAMSVKITAAVNHPVVEKCSLPSALHAVKKHKYRLSLEKTDPFIAANVFQSKDN